MRKAYKYRLRPNEAQRTALGEILDRCRELYNAALQEKRDAYQKTGANRSCKAQQADLPEIKQVRPEYADVDAQVLQDVLKRLHRAYDAFFRRVKAGERPGYPRFKSHDRYDSFTFPQVLRGKTSASGGIAFRGGRFAVRGVPGTLKVVLHRPWEGTPKTATFKREGERWYLILSCDDVPLQIREATGQTVGIDVGIETFATLDTSEGVPNPRLHRTAEPRLIRAQKAMDHHKKGSARRRKARHLLAKQHRHVANARRDFHHKTAHALVRRFDRIAVEDLNIKGLARGILSKSVYDVGWAQFLTILTSKAAGAGSEVVKVRASGTSQECASCGTAVPKDLSVRIHDCPHCGYKAHRDVNAALNIRQRAFGTRPGSGLRGDVALGPQG